MKKEITNRYKGTCVVCGKEVPPEAGFAFKTHTAAKWQTRHAACIFKAEVVTGESTTTTVKVDTLDKRPTEWPKRERAQKGNVRTAARGVKPEEPAAVPTMASLQTRISEAYASNPYLEAALVAVDRATSYPDAEDAIQAAVLDGIAEAPAALTKKRQALELAHEIARAKFIPSVKNMARSDSSSEAF